MYCPGCGFKYPPNMLPWPQIAPNPGAVWVCSSCMLSKPPHNFCTVCGSQKTTGVCLSCISGVLMPQPALPKKFTMPPSLPSNMTISKIRKEDLEIRFSDEIPGGFHPPVPETKACERAGCVGRVEVVAGLDLRHPDHRRICEECSKEWRFASFPAHWPKAVKKFPFERFLATRPGSFHRLMDCQRHGWPPQLLIDDTCPWCQASVKVRPLFQFTFVGCLC